MRLTSLSLRNVPLYTEFNRRSPKRFIAIGLVLSLGSLLVPVPVQAAMSQNVEQRLSAAVRESWSWWEVAIGAWRGQENRVRKGVRPVPEEGKEEREARVASLEINPGNEVTLQSHEPLMFTAISLDAAGNTVHGVRPLWGSSDQQVIFIKKNGEAVAGKPGTAVVMARVRNQQASVRVTVVEGTKEPYGGKKKVDSTRNTPDQAAASHRANTAALARDTNSKRKRAHARKLIGSAGVMPFIRNKTRTRFRTTKPTHFISQTT